MAQGSAPRATLDLKVKVWGMGANNQPFFQNAMAQNISATGACIYGIEPELKVGDVIGVQYEGKKARCKVSFFRGAGWGEMLRFLTRNVHEPRHAKFVSEHAKCITPWGFLEWHCDVAAGQKLLEIAF